MTNPDAESPEGAEDPILERFRAVFGEFIPHNKALNLQMEGYEDSTAMIRLPYHEQLVGNPETGVLHGGAITSLMDATCGACVFVARRKPGRIATLDLRIDYLSPATPKRDVIARCHCYKLTRSVAFVRGIAHHGDESDPIASAAGTFMLFDQPFGPPAGKSSTSGEGQ